MREKFVSIFISDLNKWECVNMLIRTDTDEIIGKVEKCVEEFEICMNSLFPYGKCKVKIFEKQNGEYYGYSDIRIKNTENNSYDDIKYYGKTIDEVLDKLIEKFTEMNEKYPEGLDVDDIKYLEWYEF